MSRAVKLWWLLSLLSMPFAWMSIAALMQRGWDLWAAAFRVGVLYGLFIGFVTAVVRAYDWARGE